MHLTKKITIGLVLAGMVLLVCGAAIRAVSAQPAKIIAESGETIIEPGETFSMQPLTHSRSFFDMNVTFEATISANDTSPIFLLMVDNSSFRELREVALVPNATLLNDWVAASLLTELLDSDVQQFINVTLLVPGGERAPALYAFVFNNGMNDVTFSYVRFGPAGIPDIYVPSMLASFLELVGMIIVCTLYFYVALTFFKRASDSKTFEVQKKFSLGFGLFFTSAAVGYGAYTVDRISRFLTGARIFPSYLADGAFKLETELLGQGYMVVAMTAVLLALTFLSSPLEKHILGRKRIVTWLTFGGAILVPFIPVVQNINNDGIVDGLVQINENMSLAADILSGVIFGIVGIVVIILIIIYLKTAKSAPAGSVIWKQSIQITVGLLLWLLAIFLANMFSGSDWFYLSNLIGPIFTAMAVLVLYGGFSMQQYE